MHPTPVWLRVFSAISLVCGTGTLSAQAEGWDGQTIGVQYHQPTQGTVSVDEGTALVSGPVEFPSAVFGFFSVDVDPTQITILAVGDINLEAFSFAGFRIYDALGSAPSIVTAAINGASTIAPASFSYDVNNIFVNFGGQSLAANQSVIIDLNFVPESSTWAAGLVALPVAGMWLRRRSARR
jgi:hypothetical protein